MTNLTPTRPDSMSDKSAPILQAENANRPVTRKSLKDAQASQKNSNTFTDKENASPTVALKPSKEIASKILDSAISSAIENFLASKSQANGNNKSQHTPKTPVFSSMSSTTPELPENCQSEKSQEEKNSKTVYNE